MSTTDNSKIDYYTPLDNRPRLLVDLGMKNAPVVENLTKGSTEFFKTISAEQASTLKSDVFITYTETDADMAKFLKDPLLGQVPALKSGGYVAATNKTDSLGMSAPSPLSIPWAMEKFVPTGGCSPGPRRQVTLHRVADRPVALRAAGRSATPRWAAVALVAAVALGAALSLLVGSRAVPVARGVGGRDGLRPHEPDAGDRGGAHPPHRRRPARRWGARPRRRLDAGPDPQPAGRPGHPRHQRRRRAGHGAGHHASSGSPP